MRKAFLGLLLSGTSALAADLPKPLATGITNPESVCQTANGAIYVSEIGERGKAGDGRILKIENGETKPFATGLDDPRGIAYHRGRKTFFVNDNTNVKAISVDGKVTTLLAEDKFPTKPLLLNDIAIDETSDALLFTDTGDRQGHGGTLYRYTLKDKKLERIANPETIPGLHSPNGVVFDGAHSCVLADMGTGKLHRIKLSDGSQEVIAEGMEGADGLAWDYHGRLFISIVRTGKVYAIPRPGMKPVLIAEGFQTAADICLEKSGSALLVPDMKAGTITQIPTTIPGFEVDEAPLDIRTEVAFPNMKWTGWDDGTESGKPNPLRPIVLTHAGDGSGRNFVAIQQGVIHVFPNDPAVKETKVFLDISKKVKYLDRQNEEGLLGLCFHPKYKTNGEFFVFYTEVNAKMTNVVSRFKVKKDNPNEADAASEEVIIKFEKPYWNHDGGTIVFGPDGYLYLTHGDGGLGNDPHDNGQNINTHLGKILRIDVDKKDAGKNYAIPADNPFAKNPNAKPEIYAYGIRNCWRMAFDSGTGKLWAADVGQGLFEEINIIEKGGNYGWSHRESLHPFGKVAANVNPKYKEPIWEYHHDVGKSITGGFVYRGKALPGIQGMYLYADYVNPHIWALKYDEKAGRVTANKAIAAPPVAIMSFGEDEKGEPYVMWASPNGKGLHRFVAGK